MSGLGADLPVLFHNPGCSKSRAAFGLLEEAGRPVEVVEYLSAPPTRAVLEAVVAGYDGDPVDLVRTGDDAFTALGIDPASLDSASAVVDVLAAHPEVLQRPLLVAGGRTVIGRPPEKVLEG